MHRMQETWVSPLGWEDALPCPMGGGHGNSLKYSCLENPMDRGTWWATVHGVTKSWTLLKQLSMHTCNIMGRNIKSIEFFVCIKLHSRC